jgi:GDP-4-dehydro-6-deoxy-D-mannose reductase
VIADLADGAAASEAVRGARPDRVFHLAADASVPASWERPSSTLENNLRATFGVLSAVRELGDDVTVLTAGSGEQYGPVPADRQPVTEAEAPRPRNPYAVSKVASDVVAGFFADVHGVRVVRARAFNHAGPGQTEAYVVSAFARQIAIAEAAGESSLDMLTGNLEPRRDFTDVRDVVRAYWDLLESAGPGAYNVCTGESIPIASILSGLAAHSTLRVNQRTDPTRVRGNEVMELKGSAQKLTHATGWKPKVPIERTLADTLDYWRQRSRRHG